MVVVELLVVEQSLNDDVLLLDHCRSLRLYGRVDSVESLV